MTNHTIFEFESGVGRVIGGALVRLTFFVDTLRDVSGREAGHALDFAEEIVDHVAPVAQHINDHAAAVFFTVVP